MTDFGLLTFEPLHVERIWGGDRIALWLHLPQPRRIGEAWLVSDYANHQRRRRGSA